MLARGKRAPTLADPTALRTGVLGTKALAVVETVAARATRTNAFFMLVNIVMVCVSVRVEFLRSFDYVFAFVLFALPCRSTNGPTA